MIELGGLRSRRISLGRARKSHLWYGAQDRSKVCPSPRRHAPEDVAQRPGCAALPGPADKREESTHLGEHEARPWGVPVETAAAPPSRNSKLERMDHLPSWKPSMPQKNKKLCQLMSQTWVRSLTDISAPAPARTRLRFWENYQLYVCNSCLNSRQGRKVVSKL